MTDYLYDGTFEGFLTCVFDHYYVEKASGIYKTDTYQTSLFSSSRVVATQEEKAGKVYKAIEEKISKRDLKRVYRVFLSSDPEKENKLLSYIRLAFKEGHTVSMLHSYPIVFEVQQCEKKVMAEIGRMMGLVRFTALKRIKLGQCDREILYSLIEPDHDILELIADHFSDRMKNDPFIIYDKKRNKAIFAQSGNWYIYPFDNKELPVPGESEAEYRNLWRKYFEVIAIQERINPSCQKRFMPVRYWNNLTEMRLPGKPV